VKIGPWVWSPGGRARNLRTGVPPWSAITELSGALAEEELGSLQLFEKLTGSEQLWWRCCRDAARVQPYWLLDGDHDRALRVISDTELVASRGAVSRAAEAADLVCRALAAPAGPARSAATLREVVARAADCWDGSPAVLVPGEASFTPETAAASAAPHLQVQIGRVLACLDNVTTDARQAMVAVCALLLAADQPGPGRVVRVPVVFARPGDRTSKGVAGTLELREFPPGPAGLFPDPSGLRNRRGDATFDAGLRLAWQFAAGTGRSSRCVLWRLSLDGGVPDYAIDGGSLGAAFAVALRELLRRPRGSHSGFLDVPRAFFVGLRPRCAITGVLATQRPSAYENQASRVAEGAWLDEVGDMDAKLDAAIAKGLRLIAPTANRASAEPRAIVSVDWAQTVHQADRYARRVRPVRTAVTAIVVLALAGASAGIGAVVQARSGVSAADAQAARQHAVALSSQLAAESVTATQEGEPWTARQLAVAAWSVAPTSQAASALTTLLAQQQESGTLYVTDGEPQTKASFAGQVAAVTFTPEGKLATSAGDGTVRVWDPATGQPVASALASHPGGGDVPLAFSPDGKLLATVGSNGTVRLWDLATGKLAGSLPRAAPDGRADDASAAFSADDNLLAIGVADNIGVPSDTVQLWDVATGQPVAAPQRVRAGSGDDVGLAFSPDGKLLASTDDDGMVRLWDTATGKPAGTPLVVNSSPAAAIGGTGYAILDVAFSPDGKQLAIGEPRGTVGLWDLATRRAVGSLLRAPPNFSGSTDVETGLAFSPDGKLLAGADLDGMVSLWDPATGKAVGAPLPGDPGPYGRVTEVAFSPDGTTLAMAGLNGTVRLWDLATGRPTGASLPADSYPGAAVEFSPDGKRVATTELGGDVRLWDSATGQYAGSPVPIVHGAGDYLKGDDTEVNMVFSPDGKLLAYPSFPVQVWDLATGKAVDPAISNGSGKPNWMAFSPNGKLLATADNDGTVQLWDLATGEPVGSPWPAGDEGVNQVAFSPDGKLLASADNDGMVRLWDVATGKPVGSPLPADPGGHVDGVAFSPDGKLLVSADSNGTVRQWDVTTGQPVGSLLASAGFPGVDGIEGVVTFSPDGMLLAAADNDGTVQLWDLATGQPLGGPLPASIQPTSGPNGITPKMSFSPDSKRLATVNINGTVQLWDVPLFADPYQALCADVSPMTRQKWRQYAPGEPYPRTCA
jgi:WD40 repeat protein